MPQPPSVTILGAGLAGLTLGRCLRNKGIRSVIYEKASSAPRNTYGITLQPWAYEPLLKVLDMDEKTFRKLVAVDGTLASGVGRVSSTQPTSVRVNRFKLESILKEGQTVETEHSLKSVTLPDAQSVEIQLDNGDLLRPAQVVDTLGVHSKIRNTLLPDASPEVHDYAVYSSKRYIPADLFASTYAPAFEKGNVLVRSPEAPYEPRLEISINDRPSDGKASISYIYSRAAKKLDGAQDLLHKPDRLNAAATNIPGELYQEISTFVKAHDLDKAFVDCFDVEQIPKGRVLNWLMRTVLVPKQELLRLLQHGIVMIGDAAHAVPILGGHGANLAIIDAINLAESFADQTELLKEKATTFYEENWRKWSDAVIESKKELAGMHHAVDEEASSSNL